MFMRGYALALLASHAMAQDLGPEAPSTQTPATQQSDIFDGVLIDDVALASGLFAVIPSTGDSILQPAQEDQAHRIADLHGTQAHHEVVLNPQRGYGEERPKLDLTLRAGLYTVARIDASGKWRGSHSELFTEAMTSVSGVAGNTRYLGSALVRDEDGSIANTGYEKQSFRLDLGHRLSNVGRKLGEVSDLNVSAHLLHLRRDLGLDQSRSENVWRFTGSGDATYRSETSNFKLLANLDVGWIQPERAVVSSELPPEHVETGVSGTSWVVTGKGHVSTMDLGLVHNLRLAGGLMANTSAGFSRSEVVLTPTRFPMYSGLELAGQNFSYHLQEELLLLDGRLTLLGALRSEWGILSFWPRLYPKLGTAYRVTVLPHAVDELKVRLTYVKPSFQRRYWQWLSPLQVSNSTDGASGIVGSGIPLEQRLASSRQRGLETGVDAVFLGGTLVTALSLYQHDFSDVTYPHQGGSLRHRGVELRVQAHPLTGSELEWSSQVTFTLNRGQVMDLPGPASLEGGFARALGAFPLEDGQSATQIVGNAGLRQDGTCCVERNLGDTEPDFRMGFSNTFRYRRFSLSSLWDWQQGGDVINLTRFLDDQARDPPGTNHFTNAGKYVEDASFLKLREFTLSYLLLDSWVPQTLELKRVRMSFSARGVFTLTRYSGVDPEVINFGNPDIGRGIEAAPSPPSRSFWVSLDAGF
jgi:hypothetical protein